MTIQDHVELLDLLAVHPGPVLLSGYPHPINDKRLATAGEETKREEVIQQQPSKDTFSNLYLASFKKQNKQGVSL